MNRVLAVRSAVSLDIIRGLRCDRYNHSLLKQEGVLTDGGCYA